MIYGCVVNIAPPINPICFYIKGPGVAVATPDNERNLSARNQNLMNKELFTIMKTVHDA